MGNPQFDVTIGKDGKLRVHVKGSRGKECIELADMIRDIIGTEESRELTSEYYNGQGEVRIHVEARNRVK